ncbi:type VII secretion-associated serine protease mycosin [Streptomyces sp. SAI-208]|uniref:type VII secretion-associated serine protease mycosin n=1 Tax=Streptomyces sp. SAI-208 TaxID=2940550 RepID=UPI0024747359|nr:type VII secretion-associated serine protease mycosin [Streptomyces sp. SAI-208]MDH6606929.1 type VII secretion-associated serine protease mycosin [Streptomyces sp. SAI-208]
MALKRTVHALGAMALTGALVLAAAPAASADQTRRDQWALDTLQAESVWKISKGNGVTVAVIDDGVNAEHQDLEGNVLQGKDFIDGDNDASPVDDDHGTGMASIIAGHGHGAGAADGVIGLAPEAKILPIRVNLEEGSGFADEIRYAVDHGAKVINISMVLSDSRYKNSASPEDLAAVSYALNKDVLIVAGAGNDGLGPNLPFPANASGVVAVGGVDKAGEFWSNSNYGPEVMLTAPATRIVTAGAPGNRLRIGDGTSDSTAFVSAAAALLRSKFPDLTAGQVANRLVKTAVLPASAKGLSLPDERYGYGTIRPLAALTEDIPAGTKYGPLAVSGSDSPSASSSASASGTDSAAEQKKADQKQMIFFVVLGVVALVVIGLIVLLIVKLSRRNKSNNGGPGGPTAYSQYGQQQPLPPQQNPYQQDAGSHGNPYQQQSQWPPQQ